MNTKIHSSNQTAAATKARAYKIFVAGVPSSLRLGSVLDFFKRFGPIDKIEGINTRDGRSEHNKNTFYLDQLATRGCCVLTTHCGRTFRRLVQEGQDFQLQGRTLICRVYRRGADLLNHNRKSNQQRVLLKLVPGEISEDELRRDLETEFGSVKVIFKFKSHKIQQDEPEQKLKKHSTYSVTFTDPEVAQELVRLGAVTLPSGAPIIVQQFEFSKKIRGLSPSDKGDLSEDHFSSRQTQPSAFKAEAARRPSRQTLLGDHTVTIRELSLHYNKPTTKVYFRLRRQSESYDRTSRADAMAGNVIFNIAAQACASTHIRCRTRT